MLFAKTLPPHTTSFFEGVNSIGIKYLDVTDIGILAN